MARARNLKPSFFTDDEIADLQPLTRLLFAALWTLADREGRLEDKPKRIKAEALPYDTCNVDRMLADLNGARFIIRYEAQGRKFIQIRRFKKHQNPHCKEPPSTIPAPDEAPNEHSAGPVCGQNIPERSGLIPDSGFPLTDSALPDSGSPPPDPGFPQPAGAKPNGTARHLNGGTARSKPFDKERRSTPTAIGALTANAIGRPAKDEIERWAKELKLQPRRGELESEWHLRVITEYGKAASP